MSNELIPFRFKDHNFRIILDAVGEPYWIAKEVCEYLGDSNYRRSMGRLSPDEKGCAFCDTPGGKQMMTTVSEAGLYHLLFNMQPQHRKGISDDQHHQRTQLISEFQRWVTHEVLPMIRKTGYYSLSGAPDLSGTVKELVTMVRELGGMVKDLLLAKTDIKALPPVKQISPKDQISILVRTYAVKNKLDFEWCWKELYREFIYRYHIDLLERARNHNTTGVAIAEELGKTDDLLALATHLYGK